MLFHFNKKYLRSLVLIGALVSLGASASADFLHEQVTPTLEKAADEVSLYWWVGGAAAVLLVQPLDHKVQDQWGQHQLMPYSQSQIGDRYISYGGNALIALAQLGWDRSNGVNHVRALLFTTAVTQGVKVTVHQERPDYSDNYAFPSGHTSSAFATATSLSYAYGWKAGIPAYAMALFTGLSRIADDKHWASDVVAGAALGVIWGRASFFENQRAEKSSSVGRLEVIPSYEQGFWGVNVVRSF